MMFDSATFTTMARPVGLTPVGLSRVGIALGISLGINLILADSAAAEFRFQPYGVINGHVSNLDPDPGDSGLSVEESTGLGFGVLLGADIFDRWSIEAGYTDLGTATLNSAALGDQDIAYTAFSFSALFHLLGDSQDIAERNGFWTYLRLGASQVENESDLTLEEEDNLAIWAGVGVEYAFTSMLAVRAELASFDGDAQSISAGVVFRPFNRSSSGSLNRRPAVSQPPISRPPVAAPAPRPEIVPVPQPSVETPRSTFENQAPIARSGCETPVFNEPVDRAGCAQLSGVQSGIQFVNETAELTSNSRVAIANIAGAMQAAPELRVEIQAHASSNRGPQAAQDISKQRVVAVARALIAAGVSVNRLGARAFGNEAPTVNQGASAGQFLPDRIVFSVQR